MQVTLSIIIVSYQTPQLLHNCVSSIIRETENLCYEIIVVDNSAGDGSRELITKDFPSVVWINTGYNAGFSRANNIGLRHAKGEYVILLNPDTEIKGKYFTTLCAFYRSKDFDNKMGLLTTRIISLKDHSILVGSGKGFYTWKKELEINPFNLLFRRYFENEKSKYNAAQMHNLNHEVDFASGACVMISRKKIEDFKLLLDEDFFLYWEDVEWSYRVKKAGLFNFFCADCEIYHVNSASTGHSSFLYKQVLLSRWLFAYKTQSYFNFGLNVILYRFNHWLNKKLLRRSGQNEILTMINDEYALFKEYLPVIKNRYSKQPSSGIEYLRYVPIAATAHD